MGFHAELSPESFAKLQRMAKEAGPKMRRRTSAAIRLAAQPAAEAAKATVTGSLPPKATQLGVSRKGIRVGKSRGSQGSSHTGLRENIAKGVSVRLRNEGLKAGVRIVSSAKAMPANQYRMNRTYQRATFKHPVFGHKPMVNQHGIDWFFPPIRAKRPQIEAAVIVAMNEAAESIARS